MKSSHNMFRHWMGLFKSDHPGRGKRLRAPMARTRRTILEPLEERALLAVFANPGSITINDDAAATPYPSTINVDLGLIDADVVDVNVAIDDINHTRPEDLDVLLVGPTGADAQIIGDPGDGTDVVNENWILDDEAANPLPGPGAIGSGTYRPTNLADSLGDDLFGGTVNPSGNVALSTFDTTDPEGDWHLYAFDDAGGNTGSFGGGWSLDIQLGGDVVVDAGTDADDGNPDEFVVRNVGGNLQIEATVVSSSTNRCPV